MIPLPLFHVEPILNEQMGGDARGFVDFPPFLFSIPIKQFDTIEGKEEVLRILKFSVDEKIESDAGLVMHNDAGEEVLILDVTRISVGPGPTYTLEEVRMVPMATILMDVRERNPA